MIYTSTTNFQGENIHTVSIDKFSKILDVYIIGSILYVLYSVDDDLILDANKNIFIEIRDPQNMVYTECDYRYFKSFQTSELINSGYNNSISFEILNSTHLIFIDENMQVDEVRDKNLNEVLDKDDD